ncbi:Hypothetical_protein [Hexamita inflata]|uniref:Hypothetical_protein n=1 Tax=Hexamita inflata TaxID=28002 RepID=A0AA86NXP6_9EUKA|nr:Hypothetical protein HINF_LOCUS15499 [Hexamita inflata]
MNLKQNNTPYICNLRASYSNQQQYVNQSEKNNLHRLNKMMNNLGRKKEIVKEIETEVQIIHKKVQSSIKVTENQLGYVNMQLQQIILPKAKLLNKSNSKIFDVEQKLKHGLTADQQKQIYDDIHVRNVQRNYKQLLDENDNNPVILAQLANRIKQGQFKINMDNIHKLQPRKNYSDEIGKIILKLQQIDLK